MKQTTLPLLILLLLSFSTEKIIYGDFDFVEIENIAEGEINWQKKAKAVAVFTTEENLIEIKKGYYKLKDYKLKDELPKLRKHPFLYQPAIGMSTAFLITEDKLMTVGHAGNETLKEAVYLFDYEWDSKNKKIKKEIYHESEIYRCKEILMLEYSKRQGDYAILQMDKKIKGRIPLKIINIEKEKIVNKPLVMIGSPDGVPLKFTKKGTAWKKRPYNRFSKKKYFLHNLDVSVGNSGAPIFLKSTGEVVGIQSGGDEDYTEIEGDMVIVKGDYNGQSSNLNRGLSGEVGSFIPQKIIDLIKE